MKHDTGLLTQLQSEGFPPPDERLGADGSMTLRGKQTAGRRRTFDADEEQKGVGDADDLASCWRALGHDPDAQRAIVEERRETSMSPPFALSVVLGSWRALSEERWDAFKAIYVAKLNP